MKPGHVNVDLRLKVRTDVPLITGDEDRSITPGLFDTVQIRPSVDA